MDIKIGEFTESIARLVCTWKYDGEYAIYNFLDYEEAVKKNYSITDPTIRKKEFLAFTFKDEVIAYGRISNIDEKIILGIGLKPNLCGQGIGKKIMNLLITESKKRYPNLLITLDVRTFNERAIRCYEKVGFKITDIIKKQAYNGISDFYYMIYTQ